MSYIRGYGLKVTVPLSVSEENQMCWAFSGKTLELQCFWHHKRLHLPTKIKFTDTKLFNRSVYISYINITNLLSYVLHNYFLISLLHNLNNSK